MGYMRGFFAKLQYKFAVFMQGRYGTDALYKAMMILYVVLLVLHVFTRFWPLSLLIWVLLGWMMFRCFSKNIPARQRENATWLRFTQWCRGKWRLMKNRWRDRRTHVYRTCPHCRAVIRLPRTKKGERVCNCPRCRKDFSVKIH